MGSLWSLFCGENDCADGVSCSADLSYVTQPSSCINHVLIICFDVLLLLMFFFTIFFKTPFKSSRVAASFRSISNLQLASVIYNGFLGLAYLCFGVWILEEKLRKSDSVLPLHWWMLYMFHGLI